jgi:FtsP/CotA-like multicopper oxidase with cupredoxin domain
LLGLNGPLIVKRSNEEEIYSQKGLAYKMDEYLMITDYYETEARILMGSFMSSGSNGFDPIPDRFNVNGSFNNGDYFSFRFPLSSSWGQQRGGTNNDRMRLRLINAGAASVFNFSLQTGDDIVRSSLPFYVIEIDGITINPIRLTTIRLQPAQRYSIIIDFNDLFSLFTSSQSHVLPSVTMKVSLNPQYYPQYDEILPNLGMFGSSSGRPLEFDWKGNIYLQPPSTGGNSQISATRAAATTGRSDRVRTVDWWTKPFPKDPPPSKSSPNSPWNSVSPALSPTSSSLTFIPSSMPSHNPSVNPSFIPSAIPSSVLDTNNSPLSTFSPSSVLDDHLTDDDFAVYTIPLTLQHDENLMIAIPDYDNPPPSQSSDYSIETFTVFYLLDNNEVRAYINGGSLVMNEAVSATVPVSPMISAYFPADSSASASASSSSAATVMPFAFIQPADGSKEITGSGSQPFILPANVVIDVFINGFCCGTHPFHLHGHHFWIMNTSDFHNSFSSNARPIRDIITIPFGGWAHIRFITDNPGIWLYHCHNFWHMNMGLGALFIELPSDLETANAMKASIPSSFYHLCDSPVSTIHEYSSEWTYDYYVSQNEERSDHPSASPSLSPSFYPSMSPSSSSSASSSLPKPSSKPSVLPSTIIPTAVMSTAAKTPTQPRSSSPSFVPSPFSSDISSHNGNLLPTKSPIPLSSAPSTSSSFISSSASSLSTLSPTASLSSFVIQPDSGLEVQYLLYLSNLPAFDDREAQGKDFLTTLSSSSTSTASGITSAMKAVIRVLSVNQGLDESLFSMISYGVIQPSIGRPSYSSSFNVLGTIVPLSSHFSSFIFHNNATLIMDTLKDRLYKAVQGSNELSNQLNLQLNSAGASSLSVAIAYNVTVEEVEMNLLRVLILGIPSIAPSSFSPVSQPNDSPVPSTPVSSAVSTTSRGAVLLSNTSIALIVVFACTSFLFIVFLIGYGRKLYRTHREARVQSEMLPPTRPSSTILSRSTVPSSRHFSLPLHLRMQEDEKIEETNYQIAL